MPRNQNKRKDNNKSAWHFPLLEMNLKVRLANKTPRYLAACQGSGSTICTKAMCHCHPWGAGLLKEQKMATQDQGWHGHDFLWSLKMFLTARTHWLKDTCLASQCTGWGHEEQNEALCGRSSLMVKEELFCELRVSMQWSDQREQRLDDASDMVLQTFHLTTERREVT